MFSSFRGVNIPAVLINATKLTEFLNCNHLLSQAHVSQHQQSSVYLHFTLSELQGAVVVAAWGSQS